MQDMAHAANAMQNEPEGYPVNNGQFGPEETADHRAMGEGMGMDAGQQGGDTPCSGIEQETCSHDVNPADQYGASGNLQGGPQTAHSTSSPQEAHCVGGDACSGQTGAGNTGPAGYHPQGGYSAGAFQTPTGFGPAPQQPHIPGGSYAYGPFTGAQGMPYGQPFPHPGPQFAGPGASSPMGYQQQPQMYGQPQWQSPHACDYGSVHGPGHPKHDAHQYGQFMQLVNDMANGNTDPSRVMDFLGTLDTQFWKGALVGVGVTLLLTSDTAKNTITGALSGLWGVFGKETEKKKSE